MWTTPAIFEPFNRDVCLIFPNSCRYLCFRLISASYTDVRRNIKGVYVCVRACVCARVRVRVRVHMRVRHMSQYRNAKIRLSLWYQVKVTCNESQKRVRRLNVAPTLANCMSSKQCLNCKHGYCRKTSNANCKS